MAYSYRHADPRLTPTPAFDALLWVSAAGFVVAGGWTVWQQAVHALGAA